MKLPVHGSGKEKNGNIECACIFGKCLITNPLSRAADRSAGMEKVRFSFKYLKSISYSILENIS